MSGNTNSNNIIRPHFTVQELSLELFRAIASGSIEDVRDLIDLGVDVNTADDNELTPLCLACLQNNLEIATLLVENDADVNTADDNELTPLYLACLQNNSELIRLLVEHGADINITDHGDWTPLYEACSRNNLEIVNLLVRSGAEVEFSLLKAFVIQDEHNQIDEIINNPPQEPYLLHLREGIDTEILDRLVFSHEFANCVDLIGSDGNELPLSFDA